MPEYVFHFNFYLSLVLKINHSETEEKNEVISHRKERSRQRESEEGAHDGRTEKQKEQKKEKK